MLLLRTGRVAVVLAAVCLFSGPLAAQDRIVHAIDDAHRVALRGHTHPLAQERFDRGEAPAGLPMERMLLVLKRSPEQQQELESLLEDLQDPGSPDFHRWLAPGEFGRRFGPSDAELQAVVSWLEAQGFQVTDVARGRAMIEFSGDAARVERAFRTAIRRYVVNDEEHWANRVDPQIPAALEPVVAGIASLHDFHSRPQMTVPQTNLGSGSHGLSPADYAVIYNIRPLYQVGINGAGSTIAIAGRTNINVQDIVDFRSFFGLTANPPQVVLNGPDPGIIGTGEEMEAVLDATWAGAVAPNATVQLVVSKSTSTSDGVLLSYLYVVEQNRADILSISFGSCETVNRGAAAAIASMAQQAAAQGISVVVSSGDSGSAGCNSGSETSGTGGLSVNVLASNPYTTSVGGTQFNDTASPSRWWSGSNGAGYGSALSYIAENVWNESCASGAGCGSASLWAGGGGASAIYTKPNWQAGVAGIPADGKRDLPDVSLTAAAHDAYLVCMLGSCHGGGSFYMVGGTSAAAPSFAGILALVRQNARARLGLANTTLYRLAAAQNAASCNGSSVSAAPATNCVFNDVTAGTNAVPGASGFAAAAGYDLATGLGSVNAYNLALRWGGVSYAPTTTTLAINPKSFTAGGSATVSVTVAPKSGMGKPAGAVSLATSTGQAIGTYPLSGGNVVANVTTFPAGSYTVMAHYAGDGTYAPGDSAGVALTVAGVAKAALNPTTKAFGSLVLGTSATGTVVLSNPGSATLTGIVVSLGGANPAEFTGTNGCGSTLTAGASCTITVTFKPTTTGARSATLVVTGSATPSTVTASLSGTGVPPAPTISAIAGQAKLGKSSTLTVTGTNFRAGLTAQVRIPSGTVNVSGAALTVVSATQLRVVVTLSGSTAYTATLVVQNAGNAQTASRTFPVVR